MKAYVLVNPANNRLINGKIPNYPKSLPEYKVIYGINKHSGILLPEWFMNAARDYQSSTIKLNGYCAYLGHLIGLLSHLDNYPDEELLILEDDVVFDKNFDEYYRNFRKMVPDDWEVLNLGGWPKAGGPIEVVPNVVLHKRVYGLECVILKPSAIQKLVALLLPDYKRKIMQVDVQIAELSAATKLKVYSPITRFAHQQTGFSAHFERLTRRASITVSYPVYTDINGNKVQASANDLKRYKDK